MEIVAVKYPKDLNANDDKYGACSSQYHICSSRVRENVRFVRVGSWFLRVRLESSSSPLRVLFESPSSRCRLCAVTVPSQVRFIFDWFSILLRQPKPTMSKIPKATRRTPEAITAMGIIWYGSERSINRLRVERIPKER